jgi:hypothetical protein
MSIVSISRLGIFDPAIAYHSAAQEFLSTQAYQITSGSQALSAELHASSPEQADEFDHVMTALAQRLSDEALLGGEAVGYLTSHHEFLANREAILAGSSPQPLPDVLAPDTSSWLQIHRTPLHGCFDELERKLREGAGDLDAFESRVKDFERIVWIAVNQPDQLKFHVEVPSAGWEPDWLKAGVQDLANFGTDVAGDAATLALRPAIDFIQAHQSDIYTMLDNMRQGFDKIFIPRTDPDVLQAFIDFLTALKEAYDRFIRGLFDDATRAVAAEYSPPAGEDTYQKVWPTIPPQQYQTSMAIGHTIAQLEQLQRQNEAIAIGTVAIIGGVVVFSIAIAVSFAIVTLVGTLPAMFISGGDVVISVGGVTINITAIASLLAGFFGETFLGVAVWEWTAIAALTITSIALWNANHPGELQQLLSDVINFAVSTGQQAIKDLEGLKKAIEDAVDREEKDIEEGIAEIAVIEIAIRLLWSHPGLSKDAAMILAAAIAAGKIAYDKVDTALSRLCITLHASTDLANLIVNGLQGNGDAPGLLDDLYTLTKRALENDIWAQRMLTVVRKLGVGRIAGFNVPNPVTGGDMDVVLKDPPGSVQVGGANSKSLDEIDRQVRGDIEYWKERGVPNPDVEAWMQNPSDGNPEAYARQLSQRLGRKAKPVTFGENDLEKCA